MVKFTIDQVRALMNVPENIRNVTVIAHVDHGKSTLTDSLINAAGITDDIGQRTTDTRKDEQLRGVTIKSTGITLFFANTSSEDKQGNLINLIDSPGHVDFSSEVTAALRLTDGALVLVDCVEGCCVQTETVLRQALRERIKPVLAINKLDRLFLELKMEHEDIYQSFCRALESVNLVISTQRDEIFDRDWTVYPERGTVAFTAGKQGWGFTLKQFAKLYTKKFGKSESELVSKFWGDNYFDTETKQWTTSPVSESGKQLPRAFCKYIVEPVSKVFNACMSGDLTTLQNLATSMNIKLSQEELQLKEKELIKAVMMKWLPAADALLEMVTDHLPSPAAAQKYRVETLYVGPQDDETADSIRKCDPNGPLVVFISKMVPTKDNSRFFAFGRVFSGTVSTGKKVRILGPNYVHGKKDDLFTDVPIQRAVIMMGKKTESVSSVPCGNTVALVGIDTYLSKSCTVTTDPASFPLINMKYSVAPVVRVAVSPKSPGDLLKLVEALKRLSKSDQLVQCSVEPTGEHVIACAGELHLEICINDLIEFMHGAEIVVSTPVVLFQETVTAQSESPCLAKSPNLHNRLWGQALPLDTGLVTAIEEGRIVKDEMKSRARTLNTEYGMDISDAKSIWAFGPNEVGPNMVTNLTRGVQYMNEIKDSVVAAFQWATKEGALANENMRGIHFSVVDALLHADTVHRGGGQLIPTARKVFYASQLTAKPALMEPVFLVEIQCPPESLSGIYSTLIPRRGTINEALPKGPGLYLVKAFLPVVESFGFTEALRAHTAGKAFPQCMFDHWAVEPSNPLEPNTKASDMVLAIRKRKGLPVELPSAAKFLDKL